MDAFELLKNDHKKVSQLFKEIESASGQAKTQVFSRLKRELDVHAHIEEKVFYPALENTDEARDITLEAYEEHKVVKDLLGELASGGAPSDEWDAKLTVLKENVEHHVEEEEGELFSKARRALSREQIERLGAEMEAEKARRLGVNQPQPSTPAKSRAETERPGVLQRMANLVGLGDSSSDASKKRKSSGTKKSAGKGKPSKRPTKSATKKRAGSTKSRTTKRGSKATGTSKAATSKTSRGRASSRRRSSPKKTAARTAGSKKGRGRATTKRGRAK